MIFFGQTHLKPITITSISRICERAVRHKSAPRPRALTRIPGWLDPRTCQDSPFEPNRPSHPEQNQSTLLQRINPGQNISKSINMECTHLLNTPSEYAFADFQQRVRISTVSRGFSTACADSYSAMRFSSNACGFFTARADFTSPQKYNRGSKDGDPVFFGGLNDQSCRFLIRMHCK